MAVMTAAEVLALLEDPDFLTEGIFKTLASEYLDTTDLSVQEGAETDNTVTISPLLQLSRYMDGSLVVEGDQVIYFSPSGLTFTPKKGMVVEVDSVEWRIERLNSYDGGEGNIAAYEAGLRV